MQCFESFTRPATKVELKIVARGAAIISMGIQPGSVVRTKNVERTVAKITGQNRLKFECDDSYAGFKFADPRSVDLVSR